MRTTQRLRTKRTNFNKHNKKGRPVIFNVLDCY